MMERRVKKNDLVEESSAANVLATSVLNLEDGAIVRLTMGTMKGDVGEVVGRDRQGHYIIIFQHRLSKRSKLTRPFERRLGAWFVEGALKGTIRRMPIVNVVVKEDESKESQ